MFGALGSTSGNNFKWTRRMVQNLKFNLNGFFIYTFKLKICPLEFSPYVCIGKPCICNVSAHALHEWAQLRAHINVTTFTRFAQNCHIPYFI